MLDIMKNFKFFLRIIWIIYYNPLIFLLPQISNSSPLGRGRNKTWVFWYYTNNSRNCGNYCIITFSIIAAIILIIIICGCWSCYRIKKDANKKESNYRFN